MIDFKYRPDVDGLRAVAVLMVVLFHAGLGFSGGYVGVDVFFVISGFLITGLILNKQQSGAFSIAGFWVRRLRRILPAASVMVFLVLVSGYWLLLPREYSELGESSVFQHLVASNIYFWNKEGYFEGPSELKPLLHTWSLSLEEQFYIGYPFLLMSIQKISMRKKGAFLAAISLISLALSVYGAVNHPSATFYLLPTRAWELMVGGLIWFLPAQGVSSFAIRELTSFASIAAVLVCGGVYSSSTTFPGANAILPCFATGAFIYCNSNQPTFTAKVLGAKPIVFVGLISYSLYLWHWPLLVIARSWRISELDKPSAILIVAISFIFAAISWRFVETPIRKREFISNRWAIVTIVLGILFTLVLSISIWFNHGFPSRMPSESKFYIEARSSTSFIHEVEKKDLTNDIVFAAGSSDGLRSCVVWGDSHAMSLMAGLDVAAKNSGVRLLQATRSSTAPLVDIDRSVELGFSSAVIKFIERNDVDIVVLNGYWSMYAGEACFEAALLKTVARINETGARVVIVKDVPASSLFGPRYNALQAWYTKSRVYSSIPQSNIEQRDKKMNAVLKSLANRDDVNILDPTPFFANSSNEYICEDANEFWYYDNNHLSTSGSKRLVPLFTEMFESLN